MRYLAAILLMSFVCAAVAQERVRRVDPLQKSAEQRRLDKMTAVVKGQCVDGVTGKPLAGCVVELTASGRTLVAYAEELLQPPKVTTGPDGTFAVRVAANEILQVRFEASLPGRWPRTGFWQYLEPGTVEQVGKVPMYVGVPAAGKVVDEQGQPISGLSIGLDDLRLFLGCELDKGDGRFLVKRRLHGATTSARAVHDRANKQHWNTTADDGSFATRHALPPGRCELRLGTRRYTLIQPKQVSIPSAGPMEPFTVVVREQPCLSGMVVDTDGQPVADVLLHAQHGSPRKPRSVSARTAADGTFAIYRPVGAADQAKIIVMDPGLYERPKPIQELAWGDEDIRIEMRPALRVAIRVIEAGSRKPVTEYGVRAYSLSGGTSSSSERRLRNAGNHPAGRFTVPGVPRGRSRIWVVPSDPKLLFQTVDIDAAEQMGLVTIELTRLVPMIVQVLDPQGMPVQNAKVAVIQRGNRGRRLPMVNAHAVNPRAVQLRAYSSNPQVQFETEVFLARTDAGGQCIVHGISGREDLLLSVRIDGDEVHRESGVAFGPQAHGYTVRLPSEARKMLLLTIARLEMQLKHTYLPGSAPFKKCAHELKMVRKALEELDERSKGGR